MVCNKTEFALYIDESGSAKPNPNDSAPHFAVGGVLIKRQDEATIESKIIEFKERWEISESVALHGNEIRTRKKKFAWLGLRSAEEQTAFLEDLSDTITSCPILVHACVVSRHGYLKRYLDQHGENTWEMMKSAFAILVERAAKYVLRENGKLMVYYEKVGRKEDALLQQYFKEIRSNGHPFSVEGSAKYSPLSANYLSTTLSGLEGKTKQNLVLQVADLCLYPVVKAKEQPANIAYQALLQKQRLMDCALLTNELSTMAIKYYCFD